LNEKKKIVILGAGIGGLSAGYFLARTGDYDVTILEKAPIIGGLCGSFEYDGFTLDYGAHKIYSVIPGVLDEIKDLMGDRLLTLPKKNRLFLRGRLVDYPLKLGNLAKVLGLGMFLKIGFGYALSMVQGIFDKREAHSYEAYMLKRFGRAGYQLVFEPLADKVWGQPDELHPEMARTRVPASSGLEVILKLLGLKKETAETNAESFYYPRAGFADFPREMRKQIEAEGGKILVNVDKLSFERQGNNIRVVNAVIDGHARTFPVDYLVSSIPMPVLGALIFGKKELEFPQMVANLQFRHLVMVYIFVKQPLVLEDQWIFFPEREYIFSRIFEQKQMNPDLGPEDRTAICCDFTCDEDSWQWQASDDELIQKCIDGLIDAGFISSNEVTKTLIIRQRNFYPRYDQHYVQNLKTVNNYLQQVENLLLTGRIGMYNYNNSDHCVDMGRFIADNLKIGEKPRDIWTALEKRVANYKIVD
jgi:protoporphyrinogen oxidase